MRIFVILIGSLFAVTASMAQTTVPSGILSFTSPTQPPHIIGNNQNTTKQFIISTGDGTPITGAYIHMFPTNTANYNDGGGHVDLISVGGTSAGDGIVFTNYDPLAAAGQQYKRLLVAKKDGKVIIGDDIWTNGLSVGNYKLYVGSGILTEKVKVALKTTGDWADYVFKSDDRLMSLDSVERFVKTHLHLPGVPSAEQMVADGNDLAKTDAKLLEKIEELTLYLIKLNKEKQELEKQVAALKSQVHNQANAPQTPGIAQLQQELLELKKAVEQLKK